MQTINYDGYRSPPETIRQATAAPPLASLRPDGFGSNLRDLLRYRVAAAKRFGSYSEKSPQKILRVKDVKALGPVRMEAGNRAIPK
jgi:hypothetical protein